MEYKLDNLNSEQIQSLIGVQDKNLKLLSKLYETDITYRNDVFYFMKEDQELFHKFEKQMDYLIQHLSILDEILIEQSFINSKNLLFKDIVIAYSYSGKAYRCKNENQYRLYKAILNHDLVFAVGPAGTGKTFLAVLMAVYYLKKGIVNKLIITRPAVEAGESLGYLPGDLNEKINPYLMPIYDALDLILGSDKKDAYIQKNIIQVLPLAYMRGRTLDDSFIILDEAQNTTEKQMLMFLTRLGNNSKMIVNGDITQIDLNIARNSSGLIDACHKLKGLKEIAFVEFDKNDVVRNPLVQTIIDRYNK